MADFTLFISLVIIRVRHTIINTNTMKLVESEAYFYFIAQASEKGGALVQGETTPMFLNEALPSSTGANCKEPDVVTNVGESDGIPGPESNRCDQPGYDSSDGMSSMRLRIGAEAAERRWTG